MGEKELSSGQSPLRLTQDRPAKHFFDWADLAMILFFSQRLFTAIFHSLLGTKGVLLFMLLLGVIYLASIIQRGKEKDYKAIRLFFFFSFLLLFLASISLLRHESIKFWLFGSDWNIYLTFLDPRKAIWGLLVILLVNKQSLFRNLSISALLSFVYLTLQVILFEINGNWSAYYTIGDSVGKYSMSFGYETIFVAVVLLGLALTKSSWIFLLMSALMNSFAIYYGSRGALLVILSFFCFLIVFWVGGTWKLSKETFKDKAKAFLIIALTFVAVFGLFILFQKILTQVSRPSIEGIPHPPEETGGSRTLESLTEGEFLADNGRFNIWKQSIEAFKNQPILGQGFFGDRLYVGQIANWGYSHNILLEWMSNFGVFGIALTLIWVGCIFYFCIKEVYKPFRMLTGIFAAMCVKLFISDSYLFYSFFWVLLGLFFHQSQIYERKRPKFRHAALGSMIGLALITFSIFVYQDYSHQNYKTIHINKPSILFSIEESRSNTNEIMEQVRQRGHKGTLFMSYGTFDESMKCQEKKLMSSDHSMSLPTLDYKQWDVQDGNYFYENVYLRDIERQTVNRERTTERMKKEGLQPAIAFAPPYGFNNSTVQFRSMEYYSFIQENRQTKHVYNKISKPLAMDLTGVEFVANQVSNRIDITSYLDEAVSSKALAIVYLNSQNYSEEGLDWFLNQCEERNLEFIDYRDLIALSESSNDLNFKNYIENTYTYRIIQDVLG